MSSTTPTRSYKAASVKDGSPDPSALPRVQQPHPNGDPPQSGGPRRSSFNFLRRKSSSESRNTQRIASNGKMSKKHRALAQEEALRKQREATKQPPRLPTHSPLPRLDNFGGGEEPRPDSFAIVSNKASQYGHNFSRPSGEYHHSHMARQPSIPVPPVPTNFKDYIEYDPYPQHESMANRGRASYASSAISTINSPRRVRRRKDPTPFNILVIGTKNSGKSSFIDFLRTALAVPTKKRPNTPSPPPTTTSPSSAFTSAYLETEMDGERLGVTLWDSPGLDRTMVDFQLPLISTFIESKFEETFNEEQKVMRSPGARDTHIHCVFLILDPSRLDANITESRKNVDKQTSVRLVGGLEEGLDLNVVRELQGKTAVIPVISKADTITGAHMRYLKKSVWDALKRSKLDPLESLNLTDSDDEDSDRLDERDEDAYIRLDREQKVDVLNKLLDKSSSEAGSDASSDALPSQSPATSPPSARKTHSRKHSAMSASMQKEDSETPALPLSIISPDPYEPDVIGRKFPWGFADPYNEEHCDFVRLRESVFSDWRAELREASREQWYEGWRTNRLQEVPKRRTQTSDGPLPRQLTVPTSNGRATSAGGREYRQTRSVGY